ncbi:Lrp/AsnC family transcriptional regulator [Pseudonocardia acaciae]|uniref:Lrp/AsnC family transcriptional regulator n=1 Tax=Pseudonocardia acaciae TaxID=551276 RepID=UPI00048F7542|nr:Lrp/AsnC family transcriptional regulator [Pseudonocardia acaciae]
MDTVTLDDLDRALAHALRIDGRAQLRTLAEVLGVSENTVARRYRRLRTSGVLRVVGALDGTRLGYESWHIRLRATPDAAGAIAAALARRDDASWVYLVSGGTEVVCTVHVSSSQARDDLLLHKLPRTDRVLSLSAHALMTAFATPSDWGGLSYLTPDQEWALRPALPDPDDVPAQPRPADRPLLDALGADGRTSYSDLAAATGWSVSTVRRRLDHLRAAGILNFLLDIPPEALGLRAQTRLWMSVAPSGLVDTARTLATHPEASFVAATTGSTNLTATVNCRDTTDLYRYLTERVAPLEAIRDLETAPIIRTVKRAGTLLPHL